MLMEAYFDQPVLEIKEICRTMRHPVLLTVQPDHRVADDYEHSIVRGPRHDVMTLIGEVAARGNDTLRTAKLD